MFVLFQCFPGLASAEEVQTPVASDVRDMNPVWLSLLKFINQVNQDNLVSTSIELSKPKSVDHKTIKTGAGNLPVKSSLEKSPYSIFGSLAVLICMYHLSYCSIIN